MSYLKCIHNSSCSGCNKNFITQYGRVYQTSQVFKTREVFRRVFTLNRVWWRHRPRLVPLVGVLLTNDQTASAGDVLAMILKALPQTSIIGENSLGIYSAMYGFELPNKWQVSLSSQKYYSSKMICYEGNGTPVNIRVKNTKEDIKAIQDPVVSAAFRYLKKRKSKIGLFIVKMKTEANFAKYGLPIT